MVFDIKTSVKDPDLEKEEKKEEKKGK